MDEVSCETGGLEMGGEVEAGVVDERPRSVYEVLTRRMLEDLRDEVGEVKGRVNTLLWLVAGATIVDLAMKLVR
jgi:hypothetical protein